jgi:hypothetical protein
MTKKKKEDFDPVKEALKMFEPQQRVSRSEILDTAKQYVTKDRENEHGDMNDNFLTIASYWNVHLNIYHIGPQDVAVMMALLKIARIEQNEKNLDNWVDACGYLSCGGEIIARKKKRSEEHGSAIKKLP